MLIFSTAPDAPADIPLSVLTDHSYGVQSLAFSNDSKWLCSLGNTFDGFLLLYTVNPKTGTVRLHSSNKCSNVTNIAWMGNSVISAGARHVKVWRIEKVPVASPSKGPLEVTISTAAPPGSPGPRTFSGRNCLLGSLLDATFTCIAPIADSMAILCTSQGDVCLLDDSDKSQKLERKASVDFAVQCAFFDEDQGIVWVAGRDQKSKAFSLESLISSNCLSDAQARSSEPNSSLGSGTVEKSKVIAIGSVRGCVVTTDGEKHVRIKRVSKNGEINLLGADDKHLPAHESAVLGVCELQEASEHDKPKFLTYSAKGTVLFWLLDGTCSNRIDIELDQTDGTEPGDMNELKVVIASSFDAMLYSGDKRGVLR